MKEKLPDCRLPVLVFFLLLTLIFMTGCVGQSVQVTLVPTISIEEASLDLAQMSVIEPSTDSQEADPTLAPSPTPSLTPTQTPPIPTSTPIFIPTAVPFQTRTPAPVQGVPGWGPWGLVATNEGLLAMRGDGSQPIVLVNDPVFHLSISPNGQMAAYVTHPDPQNYMYSRPFGYTLKLLNIYTGELVTVASLDLPGISNSSSAEDFGSAVMALEALKRGALAWSPGSTYLAFTSAQGGGSGDIYIYVTTTGERRRITQLDLPGGPAFAYQFSFSPTGRSLFYTAAYHFGFNNQEGDWVAGAWVSSIQGQHVQVSGEGYAGENLVSWISADDLILSSWNPDCGSQNLRSYKLSQSLERILWPGCFSNYIYDRRRGEVLLNVAPEMALFHPDAQPGLWLVWTWRNERQQLTDRSFEKLFRGDSRADWYGYSPIDGLSTIWRDGTVTPLFTGSPFDITSPIQLQPLFHRADDPIWYWSGDGLFAAVPGEEPVQIYPIAPDDFWPSPTQRDLFFFYVYEGETARMFAFRTGDMVPMVVDERVPSPIGIDWTQ